LGERETSALEAPGSGRSKGLTFTSRHSGEKNCKEIKKCRRFRKKKKGASFIVTKGKDRPKALIPKGVPVQPNWGGGGVGEREKSLSKHFQKKPPAVLRQKKTKREI